MELNRAVAANIKRIRKTQKLSLERTAEAAGVSRSMLGQIERGEANPSVAILGKLAAALKVPAEEFLRCDAFEPTRISREHTPWGRNAYVMLIALLFCPIFPNSIPQLCTNGKSLPLPLDINDYR